MDALLNPEHQTRSGSALLTTGLESGTVARADGPIARLSSSRWAYALIAAFAFLTFANSLGNFFLMDDFWHLNKIAGMDGGEWWKPWSFSAKDNDSYWMAMHKIRGMQESSFFFRPLVTLVFVLIDALGGGAPWAFHLSNILLHAATSLVFLATARAIFGRNLASFGAALIFAAHPAHCESVQWIAANGDLLAGLFFSIAFYGHVRARSSGARGGWRWVALAAGGFILALCSKEIAIMFPAVAFFYDLMFYRQAQNSELRIGGRSHLCREATRGIACALTRTGSQNSETSPRSTIHDPRFYGVLAVYAVVSLLYLGNHARVISGVAELNAGGNYMADWRQSGFLSAIAVNLATYLWHFWTFFPLMPLDTREAWGDAPWIVLPVWGALIAFYIGLGRKFADKKRYHFFWWWQVLTVLPALPILMSQRVLYIPSIGFCLLIGLMLKEHWVPCFEKRARGWQLFPAIVAVCFLTTFAMNTMWSRPSLMIRDQITQIKSALPRPEPGARIYLIDIWPPSYGIEEGLRRSYGDRSLDIQILSFSPKILDTADPAWDRPLERLFAAFFPEACGPLVTHHRLDGSGRLHLELPDAVYFHGLVEGLLPVESRLGDELQEVQNGPFRVVLGTNEAGKVNRRDFSFAEGGRKSYFLFFENGRYKRTPG